MRDAEDLPVPGNLLHFFPYSPGRLPSYICIHLVENQHGNLILGGQHGLQRKHHASHFPR